MQARAVSHQPILEISSASERSTPRERNERVRSSLNGYRWKCVVLLLCIVAATASPAQTFTTLASFDGTNGRGIRATLVQGFDGNLYGTTDIGGAPCPPLGAQGCGTVFTITPSGSITTLYSFCPKSGCSDGFRPIAGLALATNGKLYGTTYLGGLETGNCARYDGCGTVFEITPDGALTTLHRFDLSDGLAPEGPLIQARNGDFYGTTFLGGVNSLGTIFQMTQRASLTSLYSFCSQPNCADGEEPSGVLVQATDGSLYGATAYGGSNTSRCGDSPQFCGTIFKIVPGGKLTTLYNFCNRPNCTDGIGPNGGLVQAANGEFYGTTYSGGNRRGTCVDCFFGTIFKMTAGGAFTTLYRFCGQTGCPDGSNPAANLVLATDGNFYGVTANGGKASNCSASFPGGCGTIFKITPQGKLTTLYSFCQQTNCTDGVSPVGALVQSTDGSFYGTTEGGVNDDGTVFRLSVGLPPFVTTLPTSGPAGLKIRILGTDLTGTTSVRFNGTAGTFTVLSQTQILATVSPGATTGKVKVATPRGTLISNLSFRVTP